MTPYPVTREPVSMPITRIGALRNSSLELRLFDVEVAVDVLDVLVFVESFHQFENSLGGLALNLDVVLRNHRDFSRRRFDVLLLEDIENAIKRVWRRVDLIRRAFVNKVIRAGLDRQSHQGVFITLGLFDNDVALLAEHP